MLSFLITVVKLLLIILGVASFHEFGHFLASKLQGVGVDEFSVGFGPKIFQKKYKGTMYSLRCIPLGGYCAIEGEEETEENKDSDSSYQKKKPWQKIIILSMGVIFNFILSIVIFTAVYLPGNVGTTTIASLTVDSVLNEAGIQEGDTITAINGKKVEVFSQVTTYKVKPGQTDIELTYVRDGEYETKTIHNAQRKEGKIGISFHIDEEGNQTNQIELIGSGTAAASADLKSGDIVESVDGVPTPDARAVVEEVKTKADQEVTFEIRRGEEVTNYVITPEAKEIFDLGIESVKTTKSNLKYAFIETVQNVKSIVGSYVDLFTGKVHVSQMSGIVGIGEVVSKSEGVLNFFFLMAMISMAVGVANILPFPPLDGGKILLVCIEWITRKKVPENVEVVISYIGLGLLLALTVFVTIKDIIRII